MKLHYTLFRIFICSDDLNFNYTASHQIGYEWQKSTLVGELMGYPKTLSWIGNTSMSWTQVQSMLYFNSKLGVEIRNKDGGEVREIVMLPYSQCVEIVNFTDFLDIQSDSTAMLIFTDPYRQPQHRIGRNILKGEKLTLGLMGSNRSSSLYYRLTIKQIKRVPEKSGCKNYEESYEYIKCIDTHMKRNLMDMIGCIPPWLVTDPDNDKICPNIMEMDSTEKTKEIQTKLYDFLAEIKLQKSFITLESGSACIEPCSKIYVYAEPGYESTGDFAKNYIRFLFEDVAEIHEDTNNYDGFNLIVDIGSSMGLWTGVSVLAIYDLTIMFANNKKMKVTVKSLANIL